MENCRFFVWDTNHEVCIVAMKSENRFGPIYDGVLADYL